MAELLDDEQQEVQVVCLQALHSFLQCFTAEEIADSKLIAAITRLFLKPNDSVEFQAYMIEQSVKVMYVAQCT